MSVHPVVLEKVELPSPDRRFSQPRTAPATRHWDRLLWPALVLVLSAGILLRIYPSAAFKTIGFDEGLYRGYVNVLIEHGITSYPDISEHYVAVQSRLPAAILPPTRFLYVFAAYLWHQSFGLEALASLHAVSSFFSILLLVLSTLFAWRLGGRAMALAVAALVACAPTQIHMSQHALIDGFFAFWALLSLWLLWENLRHPDNLRWLAPYTLALALLVLTKENAFFAFFGLVMVLAANHWFRFGQVTRMLLAMTFIGPLIGVAILVNLCGSLETTYQVYLLLVRKASVLPYAIATGDGPWYRYLVDLMLVSPIVLLLAVGTVFLLRRSDPAALYLLIFVVASYVVMANVRYGMNLRYANMWDMPLRYLSVIGLTKISSSLGRRRHLWLTLGLLAVCLLELRQYEILFVRAPLYELVTEGLLRAVHILK
jgi:4-amino-4-deoxy-L-arabinose transferase-like glycosyltransferase